MEWFVGSLKYLMWSSIEWPLRSNNTVEENKSGELEISINPVENGSLLKVWQDIDIGMETNQPLARLKKTNCSDW